MKIENELGVIVAFAAQAEKYGFSFVSIDGEFPDALVEHNGKTYRIEFEYQSRNFKKHIHDIRHCDLIVCYEDNWPSCILPVLALSKKNWHETDLTLPTDQEREAAYWKLRALRAEAKLRKIKDQSVKNMPINETPPWLPKQPANKDEFLALFRDNPEALLDLTAKELFDTIEAIGTERTALNWKKEAINGYKENGHV